MILMELNKLLVRKSIGVKIHSKSENLEVQILKLNNEIELDKKIHLFIVFILTITMKIFIDSIVKPKI